MYILIRITPVCVAIYKPLMVTQREANPPSSRNTERAEKNGGGRRLSLDIILKESIDMKSPGRRKICTEGKIDKIGNFLIAFQTRSDYALVISSKGSKVGL